MNKQTMDRFKRANLVIVRAGDSSLHPDWLKNHPNRNWDLLVSYYGDDVEKYKVDDVLCICSKGPKWQALAGLLQERLPHIQSYRYVFFPDDDLQFRYSGIDDVFSYAENYGLKLSQPSLSPTSYVSHNITLHNPQSKVRFTNWIEIMAPCFRIDAFNSCWTTFNENLSGWGLCLLWPNLLENLVGRIGIIDDVQAQHTRPFFGPNYAHLTRAGIRPMDEMLAVMSKYKLAAPHVINCGGISIQGQLLSEADMQAEPIKWQVSPW